MPTTTLPRAPGETAIVQVDFKVGDSALHAELPVPAGPATMRDLLPALHAVTDAVVSVAERKSAADGAPVSCRKGCGACCRQLVPIAPEEAEELRALVAGMSEARRMQVTARFDAALKKLDSAGVLDRLRRPDAYTDDELRTLGADYFSAGVACPFLEHEACSIHADRPLACREYLVSSPASCCSAPTPETIRLVPMPVKISRIITRIGAAGRFTRWKPLLLALDECDEKPADTGEQTGPELLKLVFDRMAGRPAGTVDNAGSPGN